MEARVKFESFDCSGKTKSVPKSRETVWSLVDEAAAGCLMYARGCRIGVQKQPSYQFAIANQAASPAQDGFAVLVRAPSPLRRPIFGHSGGDFPTLFGRH